MYYPHLGHFIWSLVPSKQYVSTAQKGRAQFLWQSSKSSEAKRCTQGPSIFNSYLLYRKICIQNSLFFWKSFFSLLAHVPACWLANSLQIHKLKPHFCLLCFSLQNVNIVGMYRNESHYTHNISPLGATGLELGFVKCDQETRSTEFSICRIREIWNKRKETGVM